MGLALLFPGQGTQHPDMLRWLDAEPAAQPVLRSMSALIGDDWRSRLNDTGWSTTNRIAQVLLTGTSLAAWGSVAGGLPAPIVACGYSVGELAAVCVAGACRIDEALALADRRARLMDEAVEGRATGLLAVHELPLDAIESLCRRHGLAVAIRLGPDSAIVGGEVASIRSATMELAATGRRVTPIEARVASHTPWMAAAAERFARHLEASPLQRPRTPVVCNVDGTATRDAAALARNLAEQIARPVLWDACLQAVAERGATCVLEVGPGTTLSSMWRARFPQVPSRSIDEFRSAKAAMDWVVRRGR